MANAPVPTESASQQPLNLEASLDAALEQHPQANSEESPEQTEVVEAASEETPVEQAAPPAEEPEHIKWAKSVSGNYDEKTKQFHTDRLAKQAYELNKQNQTTAQNIAKLSAVLQHPEVMAVLNRLSGNAPPQETKKAETEEKTDEQILEDFVMQRVNRVLEPIVPQVSMLKGQYVNSQMELAYKALQDEFGKTDDGGYVYDTVRDAVGQEIASIAMQSGMTIPQLMEVLVDKGLLYKTFSSAAKNLLFPRLKETVTKQVTTAQKAEEKKRFKAQPRGTSPESVGTKKKMSFWEAAEAAEKEITAQR